MADNVFDELAEAIGALPEDIRNAFQKATIEEVDKSAQKLSGYFFANCGSSTLRNHTVDTTTLIPNQLYVHTVDWDDNIPVNELKGKSWGRDKNKKRARGKRNYSIRPATCHDLAYIINSGQMNADGTTRRLGTYFITKGLRRVKNTDKNIDRNFAVRLSILGKKFE